jgi:hypothetical protein
MCCGRPILQTPNPSGQNPIEALATSHGNNARSRSLRVEYMGKTALTVVSPLTGKKYRFNKPGEWLQIDARDRPWITFLPNLRCTS